jgi:hypothetical protein
MVRRARRSFWVCVKMQNTKNLEIGNVPNYSCNSPSLPASSRNVLKRSHTGNILDGMQFHGRIVYCASMAKKKTLDHKLDHLTGLVEKGFAAVASDITDIKRDMTDMKRDMATKEQVIALQTQVNSIERQLHETRTEMRLADLEEKVFGEVRR